MKKLLMSLSVILVLVASQSAFADHRYYRSGGYWGVSFGNHYGYSRYGYNRYGHYNRHRHYDGGAFVGGLVLGSLLTYPSYRYPRYETVRYVNRPVVRSREVIYVKQPVTRTRTTSVVPGRRLLRDLEGNCFERVVDENGDEIRVQLDPAECAF